METEGYENEGSSWGNSSPSADEDKKLNNKSEKKNNVLPLWGNERTMNLNPLILTNIQSSHYFKVNLYELKTYHEVIDEIYYKVTHLEPWEKGSRKTAGQTGMCGGVRGVGAGGIVSTAYCLLYKLFTLKLTRKQVNGLLVHPDSPYIRGLGFMYIRYTQPPADLWDWYDPYLDDPEEMDVKAGGGQVMTIGDMLRAFLTKLEWFSTLFPRIPVPIQQKLEKKMSERFPPQPAAPLKIKPPPNDRVSGGGGGGGGGGGSLKEARHIPDEEMSFGEAEKFARSRRTHRKRSDSLDRSKRTSRDRDRERERDRGERERERTRDRERERDRDKRDRRDREKKHGSRERERERDKERHRSKESYRRDDYADDLRREKDRQRREKEKDRKHKHRS